MKRYLAIGIWALWVTRGLAGVVISGDAVTGTGTVSSSGLTVTGSGTLFTEELAVGDVIRAEGQSAVVASIGSDTSLSTGVAFAPAIGAGSTFTITRQTLEILDTGTSVCTINGLGWIGIGGVAKDYMLRVTGLQPAAVSSGDGRRATGLADIDGGKGGNTSAASATGGKGSDFIIINGAGGDASGTGGVSGAGGDFSATAGAGGAASAGGNSGGGGLADVISGNGGPITNGTSDTGGQGGQASLRAGSGGSIGTGSTTSTGGLGGTAQVLGGGGGSAITGNTRGNGGDVLIQGGPAGTGAGSGGTDGNTYLARDRGGVAVAGSTAPSSSVSLDLQGTTRVLLLPRLTTTQRDALTAVDGMSLYNTTLGRQESRSNGTWVVAALRDIPATRVYNSAAITLTTATGTALTFDTERFDTDTMHSTVSNTGRISVNTTGVYAFMCHVRFAANATGLRHVALRLNGATILAVQTTVGASATVQTRVSVNTIYKIATAGDYVECIARQDSGGNLDVEAGVAESPEFAAHLISQ